MTNKKTGKSDMNTSTSTNLAALEPIVDQLLSGLADVKEVARHLEALGYPQVLDPTEQLRLALRLLECNDDSVGSPKKRQKPARFPEAGLT